MTIGTNALIDFFEASQTSLGTTTTGFADGAFSDGTNDLLAWINTDDAQEANFTLKIDWNTTAPDNNSGLNLYAAKQNVQSGSDDDVPTALFRHTYIGFFPVKNVLTAQIITKRFYLPNWITSATYHFYLENRTGETMEDNWNLYVDAVAPGPHA